MSGPLHKLEVIIAWGRGNDESFKDNLPHYLYSDNDSYRAFTGSGWVLLPVGWHSGNTEALAVIRLHLPVRSQPASSFC